MRTLRQVNIKNRPYHLFNNMTYIKDFEPSLLNIDKISFKSTDSVIYDSEYTTMKSLDNENSLYLIFVNVDGYVEGSNEDKYLIFATTDKNKEALENYTELWVEIKDQIETISHIKPIIYGKDFMKIRFESDDDLPLGKILSIPVCTIVVGSVFQEGSNYYLQAYLHEFLYEFENKSRHCFNHWYLKNVTNTYAQIPI